MELIKVKPASPALKVRNPKTMKFIAADKPTEVEHSTYWERRIQDKDVVIVVEELPAPSAPAKNSKPKHGGA
jgi:hypothetical protein